MLIQLEKGTWVKLASIDAVEAMDTHVIVHVHGSSFCISFNVASSAESYRDELAAQVNAAKAKTFDSCLPWHSGGNMTITEEPFVRVTIKGEPVITPANVLAAGKLEDAMNDALSESWAEMDKPKPTYRTDPLL